MSYSLAVVNLLRLQKNVLSLKSAVGKKVKFCAVVKSNAYGHGLVEVANKIEANVDYFAVSFLEEGIKLRYSGITKPILILIPVDDNELEIASRYDLSVAIQSLVQIKKAVEKGFFLQVHIIVNTGMNRLGINNLSQLNEILKTIKNSSVRFQGIFSHFISSDQEKCKEQANKFKKFINRAKKVNPNVLAHVCSSGTVFKTEYYFDMVRVGLALYGYLPNAKKIREIKPCLKIYAKKLCDRKIKKGQNLLYGNYNLQTGGKISIIKYGYADGGDRSKDIDYNNRCMDMSAVKKCGRYYTVLDDADKIAKITGTISYDVLVKYTARCVYKYEDNSR